VPTLAVSAVFGLLWGSFLQVVKSRLDNIGTAFLGRSYCPNCKRHLKFYDLIPILSFIILRARCRHCKAKISFEHVLFELISALIAVLTVYYFGLTYQAVVLFLSLSALIVASFADIESQEVHLWLLGLGVLTALIFQFSLRFDFFELKNILFGALIAAIIPFAMYFVSRERWMGLGDSVFALWAGILAGYPAAALGIFCAFLFGALYGIIVLVKHGRKANRRIPFGPFIAFGAAVALFWGNILINAYLKLIGL